MFWTVKSHFEIIKIIFANFAIDLYEHFTMKKKKKKQNKNKQTKQTNKQEIRSELLLLWL